MRCPRHMKVMSPGSRPRPRLESHGVSAAITITPTTSTSAHLSTPLFVRVALALERDTHLAHVADVAELRHRQAHPRRLELAGDDRADMLGERLQQLELALRQLGGDA